MTLAESDAEKNAWASGVLALRRDVDDRFALGGWSVEDLGRGQLIACFDRWIPGQRNSRGNRSPRIAPMIVGLPAERPQEHQKVVSQCGLTAGAVFLRRSRRLLDQRPDRCCHLGVVFLEDPAEVQSDSLEIPLSLLENLVALNGLFINGGELLGGMEILVARLQFPLAQALGSTA